MTPRAQHLDEIDPVQPRHAEIEEDEVEGLALQEIDGLLTLGGLLHLVPVLPEERRGGQAERPIVVHDEEACSAHAVTSDCAPAARGTSTVSRAPRPSERLDAAIRPPWLRTMPAAVKSPRPTPWTSALVVKNGSKI